MTREQKIKLAQGLFFGLFFIYLGDTLKSCAPEYSVRSSGRIAVVMGVLMLGWGVWQALVKPK